MAKWSNGKGAAGARCARRGTSAARWRALHLLLALLLVVGVMPSFVQASSAEASSTTYATSKTSSDTEYRLYVDKGRGNGDEWNIFTDSILSVTSEDGQSCDAWCVDITRLYPSGKSTSPVDALEVVPQDRLTKMALAHDYAFSTEGDSYAHFGDATWVQRYALVQAYAWWVMQHAPGTGMAGYTIYSAEVLNGEGGWGLQWDSAWAELNSYVDENASSYKGSGTAFVSSEAQTVAAWFSVERQTGSIELQKQSGDESLSGGNACYSLEGAAYGIYSDAGCTAEVSRMTTNGEGYAKADDIAVGSYWVKEISAPAGFALDETAYPVTVESGETAAVNGGFVSDVPQNNEISLLLAKHDAELACNLEGNAAQGAASLQGAEFTVRHYGGFYESAAAAEASGAPLRTWTFVADAQGLAALSDENKIDGDSLYRNKNGQTTFPLGTYLIQETKAPAGYLLNDEVAVRQVTGEGAAELVQTYQMPEVPERVVRGDLELVKVDEETMARMAGIPFEIVSNTTKERHVIVTDENGYASTASVQVAHSRNTNANDQAAASEYSAQAGVWFGGIDALSDELGALIYDTYTVNELPCKANAGHVLAKNIKVTISKNDYCVNLGTIDNKPIRIGTTATDKADGDHEAWANEQATIVDEVAYENLVPGESYKMQGTLMDKETGEAVLVEGKEVVAEIEFVPEAPSGTVEVAFTFDGTGLGGHETVVFESLYREFEGEALLVAEHADWESESQTVSLREPDTPSQNTVLGKGQAYDKTGIPMEWLLAGIAVLGVAACALAVYGVRQGKGAKAVRKSGVRR